MSVLRNVIKVSTGTGISRVLGLVREVVMAHFFGTSTLQSAFVIAFRIPNLFRRLFGEGALGAAFTPIFAEVEQREGREAAQRFMAQILGILVCVLGALVGLGVMASFGVEHLCGEGSRWTEAMPLMRIMLPYAVLICVAAILSAVLNVRGQFGVPALTPVILNIVWLVALLGVCPFLPAEGYWRIGAVCWGIFLAGFAQVLFQLPALKRHGYSLRLAFSGWRTSGSVRRVLIQMGPASLGIALAQINICVDGWLAFYGAPWAPSALEYADRIIYLPLGLFGTAFATVLLPTYSRQCASGDTAGLLDTLSGALRNLVVLTAPMAIGLMVLASPVVSLLYERGAFDAQSTLWTARAVFAYAPGILVFATNKALVPIFYAQKDIRTPVKVATWCVLANFACNVLSILVLPEGWRHVGIATSTVLSSLINTVVLFRILARRNLRPQWRALAITCLRVLFASGLMGGCVLCCARLLPAHWASTLIAIGVGGLSYLFFILLFARDALTELVSEVLSRRKRSPRT